MGRAHERRGLSRRELLRAAGLLGVGGWLGVGRLRAEAPSPGWTLIRPAEAAYESARRGYNTRIDRRPAAIAMIEDAKAVGEALAWARAEGLPVTVRSGGHCLEGLSVGDGALVVDVGRLDSIRLEEPGGTHLRVGPGCRLATLYAELPPRGRFLPAGSCGGVAVAGLTLGGGYGMFSRAHGLTCDHLEEVELVDGRGVRRTSADDPELLWACRGGGNGHFGIVTSLRYRLAPAPPTLTRWRYRYRDLTPPTAAGLLARWLEAVDRLPDEAFSAFVLNGRHLTVLLVSTVAESAAFAATTALLAQGATSAAPALTAPLTEVVKSYYGRREPLPFKNASGGFYDGLADLGPAAEAVAERVARGPGLIFQVNTLGGAISRVDPASGAYSHRAKRFLVEVQSYWEKAEMAEAAIAGIRDLQSLLRRGGPRADYCNYPDLDFEDWAGAYWSADTYRRLQQLKGRLDPDDRVRHLQSVRAPASAAPVAG